MIIGNFKVKFYHDSKSNHINVKEEIKRLKLTGASNKDIKEALKLVPKCHTTVQIFRLNDLTKADNSVSEELITQSTSYCSFEDNFNRASGRRNAISKALLSPNIDDSDGEMLYDTIMSLPSSIKFLKQEEDKRLRELAKSQK